MDLIITGMVIARRCLTTDAASQCHGFPLALLSFPSPWQWLRQHLPQTPWRGLSRYMEPRWVVRQLSFVIKFQVLFFYYCFPIFSYFPVLCSRPLQSNCSVNFLSSLSISTKLSLVQTTSVKDSPYNELFCKTSRSFRFSFFFGLHG